MFSVTGKRSIADSAEYLFSVNRSPVRRKTIPMIGKIYSVPKSAPAKAPPASLNSTAGMNCKNTFRPNTSRARPNII